MLTRRRFLALSGFTGLAAAGLALGYKALPSGDESAGDGPPTISYGVDTCAHCKMIISDARFAGAWRDNDGKAARFDDIGCMVEMYRAAPPAEGAGFWVHSYLDETLLAASDATFVVSDAVPTPMAYGIVAVRSRPEADALVAQFGGETKTWTALLTQAVPNAHGGH